MASNNIQIVITAKNQAAAVFEALQQNVDDVSKKTVGSMQNANDKIAEGQSQLSLKSSAAMGAVIGVVSSLTNKAISLVSDSIGDAIKRVDTLNNSSKVFANMGFKADDTKKAMSGLKDSIMGLPTPLDAAVRNMQLVAAATGDIGKSQKIFSAMNDAIIGFGGSTDMVNNAMVQLSQAFSNGKVDAQTWNSMMNSGMGPALNSIAKQMGITAGALKTGLSDGTVSVTDFQNKLIELDEKGGGGMVSLKQIAKDSTSGIGTGVANMKTSITRGVADIIQAIGSSGISDAISKTGSAFEKALKGIATALTSTIGFIQRNQAIIKPFAVVIGTMATAFIVWQGAIMIWQTATKIGIAVQTAFNAVMAMNPIGLIIIAVLGLVAGFVYLWNNVEGFRNFFIGAWAAISNFITPIIQGIWTTASAVFNAIWNVVSFVLGLIIGYFRIWLTVYMYIFDVIRGIAIVVFTFLWNNVISPVINAIVGAFNWLGGIVSGVWNWIMAAAQGPFNAIRNIIGGVINWLVGAWNGVVGFFGGVWNSIMAPVHGVANTIQSAFSAGINGAKSIVTGAVNWIIDKVNGMIHAVNNTAGKLPGVPHIPDIPKLAVGTNNFSGGFALVGEQGPELVHLPKGSAVTTAAQTQRMSDRGDLGSSNSSNVTLNINYNGRGQFSADDAVDMSQQIIRALKSQGLNLGEMAQLR